jgi:diguanylate cyclase (GGDEF)-like protein
MRVMRTPAHTSLSRRLVVAFSAAGAVAVVTLVAHVSFTLFGSRPLEARTQRAVAAAHALDTAHAAMLDQETGLRGYLDTGDPSFLASFRAGRAAVASSDDVLATQLDRSADLIAPLIDLRVAQNAWMGKWADVAARRPRFATPEAKVAFIDSGKSLFDTYRGAESRLDVRLQEQIGDTQASMRSALNRNTYAEAGLIAAVAAVLLLGYVWLRRDMVPPLAALVARVERMRSGELDRSDTTYGAPEIRRLAAELDGLAVSLEAARDEVAAEHAAAVTHAEQLGLVVETAHDIAGSLDPNHVVHAFAEGALRVTGAARARVWLTDEDGDALRVVSDTEEPAQAELMLSIEEGGNPVARSVRFGRRERLVRLDADPATRAILSVPMVVAGSVIGALELFGADEDALLASSEAVEGLSLQAAAALTAAQQYRRAQERGDLDPLTGLLNRYRLDVDLEREVSHARRYQRPLGLVMIDLDHFKRWNDEFGHLSGDQLLRDVAALISSSLRASDAAYRYGGEELVLLLRETELEGAIEAAERLRHTIEQECSTPDGRPMTASFGVSVLVDGLGTPEMLVEAADRAMYDAKHAGRNRVEVRYPEITLRGLSAS